MIIISPIETMLKWPMDITPWPNNRRTMKERALREEYPDLDLLWLKYIDLVDKLNTLGEENEWRMATEVKLIQINLRAKVEKANQDYNLLLKLLWDNGDGINL